MRRELDDVLAGIGEEHDPVEAVARLGAQLILQQALEDGVAEFVGRARYERSGGEGEVTVANGFAEPSTVRTTSGPTVIERPRVRDGRLEVLIVTMLISAVEGHDQPEFAPASGGAL